MKVSPAHSKRWAPAAARTTSASGWRAAANDPELMPQVYDRHYDGLDREGEAVVDYVESRSARQYNVARIMSLRWLPHHINFARIKHQDDSVSFTSDGTHALAHINRGLAAMSYVSRTGQSPVLAGLTGHTRLAVEEGERTIRQLATLGIGGATVADTPANRVTMPAVDLSDTPALPDCTGSVAACQSGCADTTDDPANCGACGVSCAGDETCVDSQCREICGALVCPASETCVAGGLGALGVRQPRGHAEQRRDTRGGRCGAAEPVALRCKRVVCRRQRPGYLLSGWTRPAAGHDDFRRLLPTTQRRDFSGDVRATLVPPRA